MTTTQTPDNTPVTQLATDAKAALKAAVASLAQGVDNAINGVDTQLAPLTQDAIHAAEYVIEKDASPSIKPFVTALIGLGDASVQGELQKLDNYGHIDVQAFRSKLDQFLSTLV